MLTIGTGGGGLQRLVQRELREHLGVEHVERSGQARFFFSTPLGVLPCQFNSLCAPEKLYAIVMRQSTGNVNLPQCGLEAENEVAAMVARSEGWSMALELWSAFTERGKGAHPRSFRVTGNRAGKLAAHLSSNGIAEAVGEALIASKGWNVDLKEYDVDVIVNLNDDMLLVLLPLLERSSARQHNFAFAGLTQPVAWAMARSLDIKPGEVILDPMCGASIILLEAAQCWREALYLGFDSDASQIQRSASNLELLASHISRNVSLCQGDARRLPLSSASVDAIVCDLPFGKLFGSEEENEMLYPSALAEFHRVLRRDTGRIVLLTNMANAERLANVFLSALQAWTVTCRRRLLLGNMESILFVAWAQASADVALPAESPRLPWEDSHGRHTWSSHKAMVRQPLRPVMGGRKCAR